MSVSAINIAIRVKALPNATGVVACSKSWWAVQELQGRRRFLLANSNCHGLGMFASIKSLTSGIKLWWDLEEQMASAIVIHVCCCGEYVERIRVEIREKNIQAFRWCALQFRVDALSVRERQYSGCVDGNGASSWRLICGFMRVIEETKSPRYCRGH